MFIKIVLPVVCLHSRQHDRAEDDLEHVAQMDI